MSEVPEVPLGDLTPTQLVRVRALQVAFMVLAGSGATYKAKVDVAVWIVTGKRPGEPDGE